MNKIIGWIFGSFFRTLGRVLVYILIGFILFNLINLNDIKFPKFIDLLFINVNADTETYSFTGSKISNKDFGSAYNWIGISRDTFNTLNFNLKLDYYYYYGELETAPIASDELVPVVFISCTNPLHPITGLYSSYYNFLDLNYISNDTCSWSWENTPTGRVQYTFARLKPTNVNVDYIDSEQGTITNYWYTFSNQSFGIQGISYDSSIYFTDINYYNQSEYNDLLSKYKQMREQQINTQAQIDNAIQNKTDIINNQNQNKTDIINNQNANTDKEIESQKVCSNIKLNNLNPTLKAITLGNRDNYSYFRTGTANSSVEFNVSSIQGKSISLVFKDLNTTLNPRANYCFTNTLAIESEQTCISASISTTAITNKTYDLVVPNNANYLYIIGYINFPNQNNLLQKVSIYTEECKNGNQAIGDNLSDIDNSINNSDVSSASSDASNFFNNFTTDTHGLTGIITAPLNAINNLTSQTCTSLVLPLPFLDRDLTLPCMRDIYVEHFGSFMTLYDAITLGIVSYWVMVRIFSLVKDFKNPEHDEIEVVDL